MNRENRPDRRDELAENLTTIRGRIADACAAAGRNPGEVTLVAVTKTWPASDVRLLASLGLADVGESRDQEAAPKVRECSDLNVTWHFVGQLQTNKCRSVASYADVVHSVDRTRLVEALAREARRSGRTLRLLIQVDLTERPGKRAEHTGGGVPAEHVGQLGADIAGRQGLELGGVMGVAPLGESAGDAFARLAEVAKRVRGAHPYATVISAGMSGDMESAVAHGATHVRIGTALLGARRTDVG